MAKVGKRGRSKCVCWLVGYIDVKKRFLRFLFWSHFLRFLFSKRFLFLKKRWQSSERQAD